MKVHLNKIASSTRNASLVADVWLSDQVISEEGYVVAVRVLERKDKYNTLEDVYGRMVKIQPGDLVAGILGSRKALRGYSGYVPSTIEKGETLSLLNLGGVIGKCDSSNEDLGSPIAVEVVGSVLTFPSIDDRIGVPAHIHHGTVKTGMTVEKSAPVIYVSGTCMHTGKTTACIEMIRELTQRNYKVGAAKLTGVSLLRDTLQMEDAGAIKSLNFTDAGVASTTNSNIIPVANGIINSLSKLNLDVIVVELGDGIAGEYGVDKILGDPSLMSLAKAHVVCATDPVAAWGAHRLFQQQYQLNIDVMTGPVTDNDVGRNYIQQGLELPAWNARTDYNYLVDFLEKRIHDEN